MRKSIGCSLFSVLTALASLAPASAAVNLTSGEAFVRSSGSSWLLGTGSVERRVSLGRGRFFLTSFRGPSSQKELRDGGADPSEIRFSVDGKDVSGADWNWTFVRDHATLLKQGELQLDIELAAGPVEATKHYVIYPKTPVIREWVSIRNRSERPVKVANLCFLNSRLMGSSTDLQLSYITGGGNYNGSQMLKTEPFHSSTRRTFDSHDGPQKESYSSYLPLALLRNASDGNGIAIGWDYLGHWRLQIGNQEGAPVGITLTVAGYENTLAPGAGIETPKAFIAAVSGDIDEIGNQLLDWQYAYLWEFTNPDYFAKTRWAVDWPSPWIGAGGEPSADNWGHRLSLDLRYVDLMRETGTDILWDDAGWYDKWGTWSAPEWRRANDYVRKHDMRWVLWLPSFLATPGSAVGQAHPDWLIPGQDVLEQSIPATADWQKKLLDDSVASWGDFQWRYDIAPAVSATDTGYLASDQNFRSLLERFKSDHPRSGVDACYGGGRWISYDIARLSESGEYTDGGVGPYSAYYTSLLVPPDKLHNVTDFDHTFYSPASDRIHLSMNPTWYRDPGDGPDLDAIRRDWEIYHYLASQGVVGRWGHVFRPRVENDDPVWYFQRMNRDGSKGVIITKHAKLGPAYFLTSTPAGEAKDDEYLGRSWEMNVGVTSGVATIDTGIYQDPIDGAYRYYGVPGESFGPLNLKYQDSSGEKPFITSLAKTGGKQRVDGRLFGMSIQVHQPLTVTGLGQFDPRQNQGVYSLKLVRAADNKVVASAQLDMAHTYPDAQGFKYARLDNPIHLDATQPPVTIYPRGLQPAQTYDVRSDRSPLHLTQTGSELMARGITLASVVPGELIFLNLPQHPGSGSDKTPPSAPAQVTKRRGANLGAQGVEIQWSPGQDDNWVSHYEVLKDGKHLGNVARGAFFFDHSATAASDGTARYEVRTVDGDGNRSELVAARETAGGPETYEPLGDFGPAQNLRHWRYEEALEDGSYHELVWDNGGYEGRWTGSGLGRIGRIWMQPSAHRDLSRTFVVPHPAVLSISGQIRKDPSAQDGTPVLARILRNRQQIWPAAGWAEVGPGFDHPLEFRLQNIKASARDEIRFVVKQNGQNRPEPVIWNPVIILDGEIGNSSAVAAHD